jgi:hypothetical protein
MIVDGYLVGVTTNPAVGPHPLPPQMRSELPAFGFVPPLIFFSASPFKEE